jgi:hypothetical protein
MFVTDLEFFKIVLEDKRTSKILAINGLENLEN